MPIGRLNDDQIINRQLRMTLPDLGIIDVVNLGDITNAVSTTTLPTGQVRPTGQIQAADASGAVMYADAVSVSILEAWKSLADQGAQGRVQRGVAFQYYNADDLPAALVVAEEVVLHTITYPGTDVSASGDAAMLGFTISVYNPRVVPGTVV